MLKRHDKTRRYRSIALLVAAPLLLISLVVYLLPPRDEDTSSLSSNRKLPRDSSYAVIFDAGSSGSRVHVFRFDATLELLPISGALELFIQEKPGLSSFAASPNAAAESLVNMLNKATEAVPTALRAYTPVRVGATAGLRSLPGDSSERILEAVRDLLKQRSHFKVESNAVTVLDGPQEGAFQWVTINYLLGNLGKQYSETVGVVDLGGGSVQMAYAIDSGKAIDNDNTYVKQMKLKGKTYYLYVHSYLHYGLLAARAELLKVTPDSANPCMLAGYDGRYKYGGESYRASALGSGARLGECKMVAAKALKTKDTCTHMKCSFGGVWNGGGGDGQRNLFVASFFFDRAAQAGFVNPKEAKAMVSPQDFEDAAKRACETNLKDAKSVYPNVDEADLPYICMDLVYQYTLLVDGFDVDPWQKVTLVKKVKYQNDFVEAAWPLGSAIQAVSA